MKSHTKGDNKPDNKRKHKLFISTEDVLKSQSKQAEALKKKHMKVIDKRLEDVLGQYKNKNDMDGAIMFKMKFLNEVNDLYNESIVKKVGFVEFQEKVVDLIPKVVEYVDIERRYKDSFRSYIGFIDYNYLKGGNDK